MLAMPSFFADMVQPSPSENISCAISFGVLFCIALLAQLDEVGVLRKPAGIEVKRNAVLLANRAHRAHILHRNRLPAAGVVGHRQHHQRNVLAAHALNQLLQRGHIHVAFEGMHRSRLPALGDRQVEGLGARKFDVGARGVEMRVVGDDVALLAASR